MALVRFGVSIAHDLLNGFDALLRRQEYPTRSKAIEDLIRKALNEQELSSDNAAAVGSIDIVYDHHRRELLNKLTDIQHDFQDIILSSQHYHLDHHHCFEIVVVRGPKKTVERLAALIKAAKGVSHASLRLVTAVR